MCAQSIKPHAIEVCPPFEFAWLCRFFRSRAIDGLEQVSDRSYARVVSLPTDNPGGRSAATPKRTTPAEQEQPPVQTGVISISASGGMHETTPHSLKLTISPSLAGCKQNALQLAYHLLDANNDPANWLGTLGDLAGRHPGLRVPGSASGFELAVRAVLGQQITVQAARTLAQRFVERFGEQLPAGIAEDWPEMRFAFPEPGRIARVRKDSIAKLGIIGRRADTIRALAKVINQGELQLQPGADPAATYRQLIAMPGIGDWTAQYICMRALRDSNAFPASDYGVMKALGVEKPGDAKKRADAWQPWRALAVMHLWASLQS